MKKFFIMLIVILAFQVAYSSEGWSISTIDSNGDEVGRWVSLAIDDNGDYHVAYTKRDTDTWYGELRYAYYDGNEWDLTTVDDSANVGRLPSIDINPTNGRPSIAYWDNTNWALKYATWSGSQWNIETIDSDSEFYQDLAFNSTGMPNVVYYVGGTDYDPNYTYFSGGNWQFETIEPSYIKGEYCSIAIDNEDDAWVSYFDYDWGRTRAAKRNGADSWSVYQVGDAGDTSFLTYTSIAINNITNYPSVIWNSETQGGSIAEIRLATFDGDDFVTEVVDTDGEYNTNGSKTMVFNSSGYPRVTYYDVENGDLLCSFYNGASWDKSTVYSAGNVGRGASIALDPNTEYARIAFFNDSDGDLMFAEWRDDIDVDLTHLSATLSGEYVLLTWSFDGGEPAGVRVLRGDVEPEAISGLMPGASTRYLDRDVEPGVNYRYWLEVTESDGTVSRFGPTEAVAVPEVTFALVLYPAYPSPSRDTVNFVYSIPDDGRVVLSVYDLSGRRVATPVNADQTAGRHGVAWNCGEVPSGVYLYRLETNAGSLTQRLVVSR